MHVRADVLVHDAQDSTNLVGFEYQPLHNPRPGCYPISGFINDGICGKKVCRHNILQPLPTNQMNFGFIRCTFTLTLAGGHRRQQYRTMAAGSTTRRCVHPTPRMSRACASLLRPLCPNGQAIELTPYCKDYCCCSEAISLISPERPYAEREQERMQALQQFLALQQVVHFCYSHDL